MENYTLNTPNGMGHMVPVFASPLPEVVTKELAALQADFMLENSTMPKAGLDYTAIPALPELSAAVRLGLIRDLLNMDAETERGEEPGRVAALYAGMGKIFDIADASDDPAMQEIAGICAAVFGEVQHGHPWRRKNAEEVMLEKAQARIAELEAKCGRAALEAVQWVWDGNNTLRCPLCGRLKHEGHADDCLIGNALKKTRGEG